MQIRNRLINEMLELGELTREGENLKLKAGRIIKADDWATLDPILIQYAMDAFKGVVKKPRPQE